MSAPTGRGSSGGRQAEQHPRPSKSSAPEPEADDSPHVKRVVGLRSWLARNRPFFEVVALIAIPLAAIVVSCQANTIASQQAKILSQQAAAQAGQLQPTFTIRMKPDAGIADYYAIDQKQPYVVTVSNDGYPVSSVVFRSLAWFEVTEYSGSSDVELYDVWVPIQYFLSLVGHPDNRHWVFKSQETRQDVTELSLGFAFRTQKEATSSHNDFSVHGFKQALQIAYTDTLGMRHLQVFSLPDGSCKTGSAATRLVARYDRSCAPEEDVVVDNYAGDQVGLILEYFKQIRDALVFGNGGTQ